MTKEIGIDLGSSFIVVYKEDEGIIIKEPSIIVIDKTTNKIIAVGNEAEIMVGRTPSNYIAIRPLKDGIISNFEMTEKLLRYFIAKAIGKKAWRRPKVKISIPSNITELEKKAVADACIQAGARDVKLIDSAIATITGLGVDVNKPVGNMLVDIGGGTTDISVISLGSIVGSSSIKIAGYKFDKAIVSYIRSKYNALISYGIAENIKKEIGSLVVTNNPKYLEIRGRNLNDGLIKTFTISSNDIANALSDYVRLIINEIHYVLENTKPELASDITYRGIVLSGGTSQLNGLDDIIEKSLGIATIVANNPDTIVAQGLVQYKDITTK